MEIENNNTKNDINDIRIPSISGANINSNNNEVNLLNTSNNESDDMTIWDIPSNENEKNKNIQGKKKKKFTFKSIMDNKKQIITAFLVVNLGFSLYLSYDSPSSLVNEFKKEYSINAEQYGRLYSLYAMPNVVMVFLGGILVDLIGTNKCSIIFSTICTSATILYAISSVVKSYELLLFSRIFLGFGGESLLVVISTYITEFFKPSQVSLVVGFQATWVQFGSFFAFGVLPSFYNATLSLSMTIWFITIITLMGYFLNFFFILYQPKLRFSKDDDNIELVATVDRNDSNEDISKELEFEDTQSIDSSISVSNSNNNINKNKEENKSFIILFKDNILQAVNIIKSLSPRMWILTILTFFGLSAYIGLDVIFTDMAVETYGYTDAFASGILAIETFISGCTGPFVGILVKKLKRNILAMTIGISLTMIGLILITTLPNIFPIGFVIIVGCGYVLLTNAIFSSVPLIVDENSVGTAYGCICTSYSIGIVVYPLILTSLRSQTGNYTISLWILISSCIFTLFCLIFLKYYDSKETNIEMKLDQKNYNFFSKKENINK